MYTFRYGRWATAPAFAAACCSYRTRSRASTDRESAEIPHVMYSWHGGRTFGVRRPLRYLTWKLGLDDEQIREVADVLNRLKTSRAQARVDWERSVADIAHTLKSESFDEDKAKGAVDRRKRSAEEYQDQVLEALRQLHETLDEDQRAELAYLLQSSSLDL